MLLLRDSLMLAWVVPLLFHGQTCLAEPITTTNGVAASGSPIHPTKTIDFSSALAIEASVAAELRNSGNRPIIPVPDRDQGGHIARYDDVRRMASIWPPIQAGTGLDGLKGDEAKHYAAALAASAAALQNNNSAANSHSTSLRGRDGALKVMVAGDSMTQGLEGDWTWRYRIWQWFRNNNINMQFVGPYKGTNPPETAHQPQPPPLYGTPVQNKPWPQHGGYAQGADQGFLSNDDHFAIWGRAAAVSKGLIKAAMEQSSADLILVMLGFNDMGWFYSDAYGTIDSIGTLVNNARAVNPRVKFAIATVPQRKFLGGREDLVQNTNVFNNLLPDSIKRWTSDQSPIHLVDLASKYECRPGGCPAGYDGLHPNAWGEYLIASAFSETLVNDFKLGSRALAVPARDSPSVQRNLPFPSNFQVFSSPQGVTATWDPVYGAHSYDIQVSINNGPNTWSATSSQFNRWDSQWSLDGFNYAVAVRASAGETIKGEWTVTKTAVAKPQLPAPPKNIKVKATNGGMTVSWDPSTGPYADSIVEYNVIFWDWKADHCSFLDGAAFTNSPAVINGLKNGVNYLVALVAWNKNGQGLPAVVNNVIPGAGTPSSPGKPVVEAIDATSVRITWSATNSAGGYRIWNRNINDKGSVLKPIDGSGTEQTCHEITYLFPGIWNYAFAISAFNGNDESPVGPEMASPSSNVEPGKGTGPKCPAKEPWCPGGAIISVPPVSGGPKPTTTTTGGPQPTDTNIPIVGGGYCVGPDCKNGQCVGELCVSIGCSGADCHNGRCRGVRCLPVGCIGPHCHGGICIDDGCITKGCIGPGCDGHGHCKNDRCVSVGCKGDHCDGNGICFGTGCTETSCSGPNCFNGGCQGEGCKPLPDPIGPPPEDGPCEGDLSPDIGLCPNGNFPLYDPFSNSINCDVPDADIPKFLDPCQERADEDQERSVDEIDCENDSCNLKSKRSTTTRTITHGKYIMDENITEVREIFNLTKRQGQPPPKKQCPVPPARTGPGVAYPGRPGCDRVFKCDTDMWPNVCNNAASAQAKRAKPTVLTYMGPGARQDYVTGQWWRTHGKIGTTNEYIKTVQDRDQGKVRGQPHYGWGLIGCQVEEYPFGNSITNVPQNQRGKWSNRAVLRLVPAEENRQHGQALGDFIADAVKGDLPRGLQPLSKQGGWTYCVDITGSQLDSNEYLLGADQSKNACGQAYGPGYLLVNDISIPEAKQWPNERRWDPWFDEKKQLFEHTVYSSGKVIATKMLPSQYGKFPSPGMKTYIKDGNTWKWTTKPPGKPAVGTPKGAGHPGQTGQNLKYDMPGVSHKGILRRTIDIDDLGYDPRLTDHPASITKAPNSQAAISSPVSPAITTRTADSSLDGEYDSDYGADVQPTYHEKAVEARAEQFQKRQTKRRGSFLDVDVYRKAFQCEIPWVDPCIDGECFTGGVAYNADGNIADDGDSGQNGPGDDPDDPNNPGNPGNPGQPQKSDKQVRIYWNVVTTRESAGGIYITTSWEWFALTADQTKPILCDMVPAYSVEETRELNQNNPGFPPSMTSDRDVWGHKGCKYIGNTDAPGTLECDGVPKIQCEKFTPESLTCHFVLEDVDYDGSVVCTLLKGQ